MKRHKSGNRGSVWILLVCVGGLAASARAVPQGYNITQVNYGVALSINSQGDIGGVTGGSPQRAWVWSSGQVTTIPTLGGSNSGDTYVNDLGQVVGCSNKVGSGQYGAYLWENSSLRDLGLPDGAREARAMSINNSGQIVGWGRMLAGNDYAFIWKDGQFTNIGALPGQTYARAFDINSSGQVVGYSARDETHGSNAFIWQNGAMAPLGSLYGSDPSSAAAINDLGQVVGWSFAGVEYRCAFMWQNGAMTNLGKLPGYSSAYAEGINNLGQAVGRCFPSYGDMGDPHACLFQDGVVYDLNDFLEPDSGWTLQGAYDINDSGKIVGYGRYNGVNYYGFLLTPVPEPATMCLLAVGSLAMLCRKRR